MANRWQIVRSSSPAVRRWGDEYVVHHALSNDTYRLSSAAGRLLCDMIHAGGAGDLDRCGPCPVDDAETAECLATLADLGLVTEC